MCSMGGVSCIMVYRTVFSYIYIHGGVCFGFCFGFEGFYDIYKYIYSISLYDYFFI
jgi:hypothetical protein